MHLTERAEEVLSQIEEADLGQLPVMLRPLHPVIEKIREPLIDVANLLVDVCARLDALEE